MDKIKDINEIKMIIETKNKFNCSIQEEIFEKNSLTNNHIEFIGLNRVYISLKNYYHI